MFDYDIFKFLKIITVLFFTRYNLIENYVLYRTRIYYIVNQSCSKLFSFFFIVIDEYTQLPIKW